MLQQLPIQNKYFGHMHTQIMIVIVLYAQTTIRTFMRVATDKNESHHEKTCLCHLRTTKAQISLRISAVCSAPLLFAA